MASIEQYKFFKYLFDEETSRTNELTKKAQIYLSVQSFFFTALFFKHDEISKTIKGNTGLTWPYIIGLIFLFLSLILTVASLGIYSYKSVSGANDIIDSFEDDLPTDENFFNDRIAEFAEATDHNEKINDRTALLLVASVITLLLGFLSALIFLTYIIW